MINAYPSVPELLSIKQILPHKEEYQQVAKVPVAPTVVRPVAVVIEFCVAVATVPVKLPATLPVTAPVNAPTNPVAVTLPVLGLYVNVRQTQDQYYRHQHHPQQ